MVISMVFWYNKGFPLKSSNNKNINTDTIPFNDYSGTVFSNLDIRLIINLFSLFETEISIET